MKDYTTLKIEAFLDQTASRSPTPGGGAVTGLCGALACALARMVVAYSIGKKTEDATRKELESVLARLNRIDQLLRALITRDVEVYEALSAIPKNAQATDKQRSDRQGALLDAVAVPIEMAALIADALKTLNAIKDHSNPYLISDLGIVAVLACATARAARYTAKINLRDIDDEQLRTRIGREIEESTARCESLAESIEAYARGAV